MGWEHAEGGDVMRLQSKRGQVKEYDFVKTR